ncbi:N-acetylmuramoyl-L-alanine amidase [Ornithinibacillus sp. JPR2-1]|uniref:N-acetylmuramoyl-L-alanine amidase n=1 Tax=Ornithinibacillus sp. JPR2-1 TaxID=2094019 RepID=UPI0031E3EAAE
MRKVVNTIWMTGFMLMLFSFISVTNAHAESAENDHVKLFEVQAESIMRTAPNHDADVIGTLVEGDRLRTFEEQNGWVKTFFDGEPVWVYGKELLLIEETIEVENDDSLLEDSDTITEEESEIEEKETEEVKEESEEKAKVKDDMKETAEEDDTSTQIEDNFNHYTLDHVTETLDYLPMGYIQQNHMQISEDTITVRKHQLNGYNILIDPGHGGKDSGAVNDGVREKDLTLSTATKLANHLEAEGATVNFTRADDTFITLENRAYQSNTHETDVFISLHYDYFNNPEVNGINTYYANTNTSKELSEKIHSALVGELDMTDRGIRQEDYYVLKHNQNPAVLLELGFISNPSDLEKVQTDEYQTEVAEAITNGLVEYFDAQNE